MIYNNILEAMGKYTFDPSGTYGQKKEVRRSL